MDKTLLTPTRKQLSDWAKLSQKKHRREQGIFLIEGEICVSEALKSKIELEAILLQSGKEEFGFRSRVSQYQLKPESFEKISKTETSQGLAAIGKMFHLPARKGKIAIACEQVSDPGNCGALIRVADFFGASELFLGIGSADKWNSKVIRGSMGSIFHQPVNESIDLHNLIKNWQGTSVALITHGGKSIREAVKPKLPILLVLGHETRGLSKSISDLCSHKITLEPTGQAESLNLVTAAAVFAYAFS